MAYNEALAERIRELLGGREGVSEKKMFGGLTLMYGGNMFGGVVGDDLMVRVGAERYEDALAQPGARPMDFTGRAMKGMVYVEPAGYASDEALSRWVELGMAYAMSLPAKAPKASGPAKARTLRMR